jgi:hypothetical protein
MQTKSLTRVVICLCAAQIAATQRESISQVSAGAVFERRQVPVASITMVGAEGRGVKARRTFGFFFLSAEDSVKAGFITLPFKRLVRTSYCDLGAASIGPNDVIRPNLIIKTSSTDTDTDTDTKERTTVNSPTTLPDLVKRLNKIKKVHAEVIPQKSGKRILLHTEGEDINVTLRVVGEITIDVTAQNSGGTFSCTSATPDYVISLADATKSELHSTNDWIRKDENNNQKPVTVYVQSGDGAVIDLDHDSWLLDGQAKPIGVLVVGDQNSSICEESVTDFQGISSHHCHQEFVLVRRLDLAKVIVGAEVKRGPKSVNPKLGSVFISHDLLEDTMQFVLVNGQRLRPGYGPFEFDNSFANTISVYRRRAGCRLYSKTSGDWASIKIYPSLPELSPNAIANGITVGPGKIFDTTVLKRMLNDTAAQLASLSGFSSASITGAFGNLQGVSRDTSFLSVQATTVPLPGISSTNSTGLNSNASLTNTAPVAGSSGVVTVQCPDGSLPTIGSGGVQGCTAIPSSSNVSGSSSTVTTVPVATSQGTSGTTANQQNSQTTTSPSFGPTVPSAPNSTALAPPGNVGVASSDILAEQVQLISQITTLRLLLQGASSDQYLAAASRAVATRAQTTLGFSVSIDPPRQYKHAVAEVRILVIPPDGRDGVSIMNLLPTDKTYNVAKVTSRQDAFGAGVVIEAISIGVSTGRAKDRLYLAKDTDTVALQYPAPGVTPLDPLNACDLSKVNTDRATVFGWQFRPVLGAEYVKSGQREVFAQLALPAGLNEDYAPTVLVQTVWRAYDPKKQVLGGVYKGSCSVEADKSAITMLNPLIIRDLHVSDIGGSQIRMTAKGDFFTSGLAIRSGPNNVGPTSFDGTGLEVFASLHDTLQVGDLSIVSQTGVKQPFAIVTDPGKNLQCGIAEASILATPRPDGNSMAHLDMKLGPTYNLDDDEDGLPQPFVLIGSQVYGVQETPFLSSPCRQNPDSPVECEYDFLAPTSALKNAQSFLVQDISWDSFKKRGTIEFAPSLDKIAVLASYPADKAAGQGPPSTAFAVSGYKLNLLDATCTDPKKYCLRANIGEEQNLAMSLHVASENEALITLGPTGKAKSIRFLVGPVDKSVEWDLALPKTEEPAKPSLSPPYLFKGDSQTVSISGGDIDFSAVKDVKFDGKLYFTPTPDPTKPSADKLELLITSDVTKTGGRKEFVIDLVDSKTGKPSKITLALDVVLR